MSARAIVSAAYSRAAFPAAGPLSLIAVGKAASAMASAFLELHCGPVRGVVIGTHGGAPSPLVWVESAHPVPDLRSETAASAALETAAAVGPDEDLVVLVSGGASALMARAAEGLTLADKQSVTRQLLAAGADISALNCVRKHLSAVKGGRLAQACCGRLHAWLLSDVVGDDPSVIGSGPTVPDPTTYVDALDVLDRFGGREAFPPAVVSHLVEGAAGRRVETPKSADALRCATTQVVGSAALAVAAAARAARERGYEVVIRPDPVVGEARAAAETHVEWIRRSATDAGRPLCVLSSGETTVHVTGNGRGGRNQEFALAAALSPLPPGWVLASLGTDGVDGPTAAAGAIVDAETTTRAASRGLDAIAYLHANDSWTYFSRAGGHIVTGPTDTNVGDLQLVLVPASQGD